MTKHVIRAEKILSDIREIWIVPYHLDNMLIQEISQALHEAYQAGRNDGIDDLIQEANKEMTNHDDNSVPS